ncbi:MAG: glucuronate isomerase [Cyclobacteriaceae bacterium]
MKKFLDQDFLLQTDTAKKLYHEYASDQQIIDYHCHLSPADIAEDRIFNNISEAWLEGDHYKWRAMRANGVDEDFITGGQPAREKFRKWAETVPDTFRNPLFHWTHLELQRYFGITDLLNAESADRIYDQASEMLNTREFSCRSILQKMKVRMVGTTDDPSDNLESHLRLKEDNFSVKVLPTFRPDNLYAVDKPADFNAYINDLSQLVGHPIGTFKELMKAASERIEFFHKAGGRISDHGLEQLHPDLYSLEKADEIIKRVQNGGTASKEQVNIFKMTTLVELSKMYAQKGWTQQFHLGAIRNNNDRMMRKIGADAGLDSIGDFSQITGLAQFLNQLENTDQLAQTIVYNLNPSDNEAMATMVGNFNGGGVPGKMQFGSGWWYLDQKDGMEKQLNALSNMGLLSRFIGMLTDSRSFLSFPRHEYFRRVLCNLIGNDVENGELPNDINWLGQHVENICFNNAHSYLKL